MEAPPAFFDCSHPFLVSFGGPYTVVAAAGLRAPPSPQVFQGVRSLGGASALRLWSLALAFLAACASARAKAALHSAAVLRPRSQRMLGVSGGPGSPAFLLGRQVDLRVQRCSLLGAAAALERKRRGGRSMPVERQAAPRRVGCLMSVRVHPAGVCLGPGGQSSDEETPAAKRRLSSAGRNPIALRAHRAVERDDGPIINRRATQPPPGGNSTSAHAGEMPQPLRNSESPEGSTAATGAAKQAATATEAAAAGEAAGGSEAPNEAAATATAAGAAAAAPDPAVESAIGVAAGVAAAAAGGGETSSGGAGLWEGTDQIPIPPSAETPISDAAPRVSPFEAASPFTTSSALLDDDDEGAQAFPVAPSYSFSLLPLTWENVSLVLEEVRPFLQGDGGDCTLRAINEAMGIVTVKLEGACVACPSSSVTVKFGIERRLRERIPAVTSVVAVASDDGEVLTSESVEQLLEGVRPFLKATGDRPSQTRGGGVKSSHSPQLGEVEPRRAAIASTEQMATDATTHAHQQQQEVH
eukprot:GHVT01045329.1.p1 GENE.GHVT01045329.1~~GHVT01045329.1.p1  ORF type:complete len:547 (+),score=126.94 GHVT01045329.1:66-1643(+)